MTPPRSAQRWRYVVAFLGCGVLLVGPQSSHAQTPAYLAAWPTVERVLTDHQGEDHEDTLARQAAALNQLDRAMEDMADDRRFSNLTADELALRGRLRQASAAISEEVSNTLSSDLGSGFHWPWEQAPRTAWYSRQWEYESDPEFRAATLSRYLPADLRAELEFRKAGSDARGQAAGRELMRGLGQREGTWLTMTPQEQEAFLNLGMVLLALLGLMMVREMRRFGVRPSDPLHLRAGFRKYKLELNSGLVEQYESNTGGLNEGFWLREEIGWYQVGVQGVYAQIPEGHLATAVSAKRKKSDEGYVLFFDHDADVTRPVVNTLRKIFAPRRWLLLPILGLAFLSGSTNNSVPGDSPLSRGLLTVVIIWALATLTLRWVPGHRVRRFLKRGAPHTMAAAAKEAEELRPRILPAHIPFPTDRTTAAKPAVEVPEVAVSEVEVPEVEIPGDDVSEDAVRTAAAEVLQSIEPYIGAALQEGRTLSPAVWTDPFVQGFVTVYSASALRLTAGVASPSASSVVRVCGQVHLRFYSEYAGRVQSPEEHSHGDPAFDQPFQSGLQSGRIVLACFAGDLEALAHPVLGAAPAAGLEPYPLKGTPPDTRLHPGGPHAGAGRRIALYLFTEQLMALDARRNA